jgi:hypothetical protein
MSLPAGQRRALSQIELTLADDHPGLGALFAVFTRLAGQEAMPVTEQVTAWPWPWRWQRRMRPGVATVVGLAMVTGALLAISLMLPVPQVCAKGTVASVAAPAQPVPAGFRPACAAGLGKPAGTGQSEFYAH